MSKLKCKYCNSFLLYDEEGNNPEMKHRLGCPDINGLITRKDKQIEKLQDENDRLKSWMANWYEETAPDDCTKEEAVKWVNSVALKGGEK